MLRINYYPRNTLNLSDKTNRSFESNSLLRMHLDQRKLYYILALFYTKLLNSYSTEVNKYKKKCLHFSLLLNYPYTRNPPPSNKKF